MKEIPILFSTPMVQAILDGRKTMTRRIVKTTKYGWDCQKMEFAFGYSLNITDVSVTKLKAVNGFHAFFKDLATNDKLSIKCPYTQPGNILWVRESFATIDHPELKFRFKADHLNPKSVTWKPSIHMPKAAARIWLHVEEIRVERLQDITEEDARAEGFQRYFNDLFQEERYFDYTKSKPGQFKNERLFGTPGGKEWREAISSFESLWIKINGEESWDTNPWVWVVKYKVLSTTGRPQLETLNLKLETK